MEPGQVPVYVDESEPRIADLARGARVDDWQPANGLTIKLIRCLESIRDLRVPCEFLARCVDVDKRFVKSLSVPLVSLAQAIRDVFGEVEHSLLSDMPKAERSETRKRQTEFVAAVLKRDSALKTVRDKIGAHVDNAMILNGEDVWDRVDLQFYIRVLSRCLTELSFLLHFDNYAWARRSERDDIVQLMSVDGTLVDLVRQNGELEYIEAVSLVKSPRHGIVREVNELVAVINRIVAAQAWPARLFPSHKT